MCTYKRQYFRCNVGGCPAKRSAQKNESGNMVLTYSCQHTHAAGVAPPRAVSSTPSPRKRARSAFTPVGTALQSAEAAASSGANTQENGAPAPLPTGLQAVQAPQPVAEVSTTTAAGDANKPEAARATEVPRGQRLPRRARDAARSAAEMVNAYDGDGEQRCCKRTRTAGADAAGVHSSPGGSGASSSGMCVGPPPVGTATAVASEPVAAVQAPPLTIEPGDEWYPLFLLASVAVDAAAGMEL